MPLNEASKASVLREIQAQKQIWRTNQPKHYRFIIQESTYFICGLHCGPNEVEVKDGQVVRLRYRGKRGLFSRSKSELSKGTWQGFSIEDSLARYEAFVAGVDEISVLEQGEEEFWFMGDYDPKWGFPVLLARNDPTDYHGQHVLRIGYFEVIEE